MSTAELHENVLERLQSMDFNKHEIASILYEFTSFEHLTWLMYAEFQEILDAMDFIQDSYKL